MVWTTADTNRVCSRCLELKDTVVGRTDETGVTLPPLHPRCRCAIMYREEKPDRLLSAPPNKPASTSSGVLTSPPRFANECKTFDELKTYWAENYNVKVAASVTELNFEAVRAALEGISSSGNESERNRDFRRGDNVHFKRLQKD